MKRWLLFGTLLVCALVTFESGCGKRATNARPNAAHDEPMKTDTPGLITQGSGPYLIPLAEQRRWSYTGLPTPNPSSKPNYLLRSLGFKKASSTLDGEAAGTLRELAKVLKEKTSIRVLCIGLTDGGPEKVNSDNLGLGRAQAAKQTLVAAGVAKDRIEVASFGATQAQSTDPIGQELERVCEVWLLTE
ncbi:MAG: OmpA family protein [Candidatus Eisenbacteria bacterium]